MNVITTLMFTLRLHIHQLSPESSLISFLFTLKNDLCLRDTSLSLSPLSLCLPPPSNSHSFPFHFYMQHAESDIKWFLVNMQSNELDGDKWT